MSSSVVRAVWRHAVGVTDPLRKAFSATRTKRLARNAVIVHVALDFHREVLRCKHQALFRRTSRPAPSLSGLGVECALCACLSKPTTRPTSYCSDLIAE